MTTVNDVQSPAYPGDRHRNDTLNLTAILGDLSTFENDILHQTPHVRDLGTTPVSRILSLHDVDYLLTATGLRTPFVNLVRNDQVVPGDQYCRRIRLGSADVPDLVHPGRVFQHMKSGATLILQGMQRYWPPLTQLCRQVESRWGFACHANAYLTPPAAQGFTEHEDSHDTLIIQTHGAKVWTVAQLPTGAVADVRGQEGHWTFTLGQPASFYIPAATNHAAYTAGQASLHVTIGMTAWTWERVARKALEAALTKLDLSERLPTGALVGGADVGQGVKDLTTKLAETIRHLPPNEIVDSLVAEFINKTPPLLSGQLENTLTGLEVSDTSCIARRPGALATVIRPDGYAVLVLGDRRVQFPPATEPALRHILALTQLRVSELAPFLAAPERIALAEQLIHEGLLILKAE